MTQSSSYPQRRVLPFDQVLLWLALAGAGLLLAVFFGFFLLHAWQILRYPYPLDYGEGPLLAQARLLHDGAWPWQLYADPAVSPYFVVNYPPLYVLAAAAFSWLTGDLLLAGRLVSLLATFGCMGALWVLSQPDRPSALLWPRLARLVMVLLFPALPIVREWAVMMRVDLLGVCLGLWGLVCVRRLVVAPRMGWPLLLAALLFTLSLYTKQSLLAAPLAGGLWLLIRDWRRALWLGALTALLGGGLLLLFSIGSGGWFLLHILTANANEWQWVLFEGFWRDQIHIHWSLWLAAGISLLVLLWRCAEHPFRSWQALRALLSSTVVLAGCYTLLGAIAALGIGKVGAYLNYFLEFYAGLIWLLMLGVGREPGVVPTRGAVWRLWFPIAAIVLALGGLVRYYPLWSQTFLKPYGLIEGENPSRLSFGGYGIWQDLRRERVLLRTMARVNEALTTEVQAAGGPIFTDVPGIASQANVLSRVQSFEHRQLYDVGAWSQQELLRDLANGQVPLIVLDYLGNWLTPEMITLITNRYVQTGSRGAYDLYRPLDLVSVAPEVPLAAEGLQLRDLALPQQPIHPGSTFPIALAWQLTGTSTAVTAVQVALQSADGAIVASTTAPLLYGLPDVAQLIATESAQQIYAMQLPADVASGAYRLTVALQTADGILGTAVGVGQVQVIGPAEQPIGRFGYSVSPEMQAAREKLGMPWRGEPQMPAVPVEGGLLQCFREGCLMLQGDQAERLPLGSLIMLGDDQAPVAQPQAVSEGFAAFYQQLGGEAVLGPVISPELRHGDTWVQYTRFARMERPLNEDRFTIAPLGEAFLRLPNLGPYRWPPR